MKSSGTLYVVATPIGNLEDITLRALRILKEADVVACENLANTRKLLAHFDIHTPAVSDRNALALLTEGKHVALVSDAGTPGVSDPGALLVSKAREAGVRIEVVPGPSALAAALSVAGLRAREFSFWGFLPLKKGRDKMLKSIAVHEGASVLYESPHRIMKTLSALATLAPARRIGLYRELTKVFEEHLVGTAGELYEILSNDPHKQRGEFVVIVEGV